ncbi:carbonic anhydrase [Aquitalea denitrificans]|uniref:carbonic anhydrase n=1 Tax=Aquitalea denitrificans TaxID=519081 RepID=UPI001F0D0083|nr:carbonic anhydrase [Aquitalea denitrificans]
MNKTWQIRSLQAAAVVLGGGLLAALVQAEEKAAAPAEHGKPIVLPGKQAASAAAESPSKTIVLPGKLAASMAAARAKPKEPEILQPEVKQAAAPQVKAPLGPSPEVHAPGGAAHAAKRTLKPHRAKPKPVLPKPAESSHDEHGHGSEVQQVRAAVTTILHDNTDYMAHHSATYFKTFADKQTPRATVVTCSDSRVQSEVMDKGAVNDLFMVRDIGNQLATAEGSVEYGVRHLHTPLLIFVGHSACGAIKAASADYGKLEPAIRKELATINIPQGIDPTDGALLNVNNQVESAILKFSGEVEQGHLAVLGAFYDFRNDLRQGAGKLIITNLNGETEPARIRELMKQGQYFKYSFMR